MINDETANILQTISLIASINIHYDLFLDYSECGTSPFKPFDARGRIVGGEKTNARNWPWAVRVLIKGKFEHRDSK